jgi:geranylgeranyl pyrophosphate synthase
MTLRETKKKMLAYRDFYGGDLICEDEIKKAKTKKELSELIERHRNFMEDMLSDAMSHLEDFKKEVDLVWVD